MLRDFNADLLRDQTLSTVIDQFGYFFLGPSDVVLIDFPENIGFVHRNGVLGEIGVVDFGSKQLNNQSFDNLNELIHHFFLLFLLQELYSEEEHFQKSPEIAPKNHSPFVSLNTVYQSLQLPNQLIRVQILIEIFDQQFELLNFFIEPSCVFRNFLFLKIEIFVFGFARDPLGRNFAVSPMIFALGFLFEQIERFVLLWLCLRLFDFFHFFCFLILSGLIFNEFQSL